MPVELKNVSNTAPIDPDFLELLSRAGQGLPPADRARIAQALGLPADVVARLFPLAKLNEAAAILAVKA